MGFCCSPDVFQEVMEKTLKGIEDVEKHIDDIGMFSKDWKSHVKVLDEVCSRLQDAGFSVNLLKCKFGVKESDFLAKSLVNSKRCQAPTKEDSRNY